MSIPILACPPKDKARQLKLGIVGFAPGPDMTEGNCHECQATVWIGPKAREFQEKNPSAVILCFGCAAIAGGRNQLQHLGGKGGRYLFDPTKVD